MGRQVDGATRITGTVTVGLPRAASTPTETISAPPPWEPTSQTGVIGSPVQVGGTRIGEVAGVYVDRRRNIAIGLEVASEGGIARFLPWVAARFHEGTVAIESALFLVDDGSSYERLGAELLRSDTEVDVFLARPNGAARPNRATRPRNTVVSATPAAGSST